jgi:hypothetical protein
MKKSILVLATVLAVASVAALPGCSTNTQGDSAAPVFLTGQFTQLPFQKLLVDATALQFTTTTLNNVVKTSGITSLQFLDVQLESYHVRWTRLDGGTVASPPEDFGGNVIVPANGTSTLTNYPYMRAANLLLPPLDQLYPFNGGIDRVTGKTVINQAGHVIWYGHTLSGQPVVSVEATFGMAFTYNSAAVRVEGKLVR